MKVEEYRGVLAGLELWDAYLLEESHLPGPRGNLELAQAAADLGDEALFLRYLELDAGKAPTNSPYEFLAFCGAVGVGRLAAEGRRDLLPILRRCASDPRWRMREGVAMALQRLGDADMEALLEEMERWSTGGPLEQRAAAAAVCEPRLLGEPRHAERVLDLLDGITAALERCSERRGDAFAALRKGLGYCWSVAVAALPEVGKARLERWLDSSDRDVRWVMRQNLGKARLERMDGPWVAACRARMGEASSK